MVPSSGQVTERLKVQRWKCCVRVTRTVGSNPTLSVVDGAHLRVGAPTTPHETIWKATGRNDDPVTMSDRLDGL